MVDRVPRAPSELASRGGVAYALFAPDRAPEGAVLVLHGAGSQKESHFPFARALTAHGLIGLVVDLPGHGQSEGNFDDRVLERLAEVCAVVEPGLPLGLRGSSLGGYLALVAAGPLGARAVAAVCPASAEGMRRAVAAGRVEARLDPAAVDRFLARHDELVEARRLGAELLLLHAEGDQVVPIEHSRAVLEAAGGEGAGRRMIAMPGGHHRSIQRDDELTAATAQWLARTLRRPD